MKERPILMKGPLVSATLKDQKTQTRRVMKPQPHMITRGQAWDADENPIYCPYGQVGDRLWVRETFSFYATSDGDGEIRYSDGSWRHSGPPVDDHQAVSFFKLVDKSLAKKGSIVVPSIHMPRWASRITLEITDIRVERLQDISEEDAMAEGIKETRWDSDTWVYTPTNPATGDLFVDAKSAFRSLWESINGPGSWEVNPFVWVVEFRRVEEVK